MTRAPTYPIHRNRRNSISIRFSVRSIRFSRCGPRAVGPRPPASLALGGKEIHYPPRGAESRASSRSTGPPQPGGRRDGRLPACPCMRPARPRKSKKPPGGGQGKGPPEGGPFGAEKRPARARLPILPQPGAAVLSATAGLTAEFGTGSGDPRLHGLARAGRSSCGTLAAAWRPIGRSDRAGHARRYV